MRKKGVILIGIISILCILGIGFFINKNSDINEKYELVDSIKSVDKIEIYDNEYEESTVILDKNIISNFVKLMSKRVEEPTNDMSNISSIDNKIILYDNRKKIEIEYSYDTLYEFGFLEYNGENIYLPYEFFRLIQSCNRHKPKEANLNEDVVKLFSEYNWSPSFLINKEKRTLPNDLLYAPEKGIDEVYWSYVMEFSKSIDMDFSDLVSKDIDCEMYYLIENMPEFAEPMDDSVGVVIRYKGNIVGAYIQSSLINRAMTSLDRKSFEDMKKTSIEEYILQNHIDENSNIDKILSKISNEDIIKMYFTAIKEKDIYKQLALLDINKIIDILDMNIYQDTLFQEPDVEVNLGGYLEDFKIIDIKKDKSQYDDQITYKVKIDIKSNESSAQESGVFEKVINLKKSSNGVYKVNSEGF